MEFQISAEIQQKDICRCGMLSSMFHRNGYDGYNCCEEQNMMYTWEDHLEHMKLAVKEENGCSTTILDVAVV
jgi:hypothetical protein